MRGKSLKVGCLIEIVSPHVTLLRVNLLGQVNYFQILLLTIRCFLCGPFIIYEKFLSLCVIPGYIFSFPILLFLVEAARKEDILIK